MDDPDKNWLLSHLPPATRADATGVGPPSSGAVAPGTPPTSDDPISRLMRSLGGITMKRLANAPLPTHDELMDVAAGTSGSMRNVASSALSAVKNMVAGRVASAAPSAMANMAETGFANMAHGGANVELPLSGAFRGGSTTTAMGEAIKRVGPQEFQRMAQAEITKRGGGAAGEMAAVEQTARDLASATLPKKWSVISAELHNDPTADAAAMSKLKKSLSGYKHEPVTGPYENPRTGQVESNNSFLVHDMAPEEAVRLGAQHGQQSVLTHLGLHDLDKGSLVPSRGTGFAPHGSQNYFERANGHRFTSDLAFP